MLNYQRVTPLFERMEKKFPLVCSQSGVAPRLFGGYEKKPTKMERRNSHEAHIDVDP